MELLKTFAALSLATGAVMALLPEGGLRKTAGMVVGLLMLLCWAEGIAALLHWPMAPLLPATVLTPTGASVTQTAADAAAALQQGMEGLP